VSDLVKFRIPAAFVTDHVTLTPDELAYGFRHGWLTPQDVVQVALATLSAGASLSQPEEALALLLSDELDQVPFLIDELEHVGAQDGDPAAVWLFLALAWIYEHRTEFYDPFAMIEMLYADFGYPDDIKGFVRFMPAPPGSPAGLGAMTNAWRAYLEKGAEAYRHQARPQGECDR